MKFKGIVEIMYFVPNRREAANWYAQLLDTTITYSDIPEFFFIRVGLQEIWFHEADNKMPAGAAGQVAYWQVENFDDALERAKYQGAELYRGPLKREEVGQYMCQVKDPFGNLIGLVGPKA